MTTVAHVDLLFGFESRGHPSRALAGMWHSRRGSRPPELRSGGLGLGCGSEDPSLARGKRSPVMRAHGFRRGEAQRIGV